MRVVRTSVELVEALGATAGPTRAPAGLPTAPTVAVGEPRVPRAVVMTMGALHEGHLTLVRRAAELATEVVVTIFVNPLQFGVGEDLERYPRDLDRDVALLETSGATVVFAPPVADVYPTEPVVTVSAGALGRVLEGAHRPAHFDGVLTVVLKLMHLVRPDVALFGQKDAQQLMAVRRMVADLDVGVRVVGVPIVRDADGLALSSRNAYLDAEQRVTARALYMALTSARQAADAGATAGEVRAAAARVLSDADGLVPDYVALVDPDTALDVADGHHGPALLAVAARVGSTRLIDNAMMDVL